MSRRLLLVIKQAIHLYQKTLSPDHGAVKVLFVRGVCRYEPTCSQYAGEAITAHGWRGVGMAIARVLRCHPFRKGGYDPVKE